MIGRVIAIVLTATGLLRLVVHLLDWIGRYFDFVQVQELVGKLPAPLAFPYEQFLLVFGPLGLMYLAWDFVGRPPIFPLGPAAQRAGRMSFVDLARLAAQSYGWNFNPPSYQTLDFEVAVQQAAGDGAIVVEGRTDCRDLDMAAAKASRILQPINRDDWVRLHISAPCDGSLLRANNFHITADDGTKRPVVQFWDLHVSRQSDAVAWLESAAPSVFRGNAQADDEAKTAAREERENQERRETRNALAKFIAEADALETECRGDDMPPNGQIGDWNDRVIAFLRARLDEGYVARFSDSSNFNPEAARLPPGPGQHMASGLILRKSHLLEFLKELK